VAKIGAGFAVEPGLVLTVAHTLRGAQAIVVDTDPADLVFIDHRIDVAVLRVRGANADSESARASFAPPRLGSATLLRRRSKVDRAEEVSVRVTKVSPINIEEPIDKVTYHRDGFVAVLDEGTVSAGDSGSPIVDGSVAIVGMVFATDTDTGRTAFAVSSSELQQALVRAHDPPVSTGPCPD
jgi:S1-C subfamily serine protease